jgi:hypothetical protein
LSPRIVFVCGHADLPLIPLSLDCHFDRQSIPAAIPRSIYVRYQPTSCHVGQHGGPCEFEKGCRARSGTSRRWDK